MKLPNLPEIPDKISRADMVGFVASLGLPVDQLCSFRLAATGIDAVFYALNDEGCRYYDTALDGAVMHTVHIDFEEGPL